MRSYLKSGIAILCVLLGSVRLYSSANPRQIALMQKVPAPQLHSTATESPIRFTYRFGQTELQVKSVREPGHWHLGLDLNLSEYLGSRAVGDLIEEYLLAYLAGADLGDYGLKSNLSTFSTSDLAARIPSLKANSRISTQTLEDNAIQIDLENTQIKLSFQIALSLQTLYGMQDKKDLEEGLWRQLLGPELTLPQAVYPSMADITPYQDSLYVWERAVFDHLFSASLFLMVDDGKLSFVNSSQYSLETLINYLLQPQTFDHEQVINLRYNMYGNRHESIQVAYPKLFGTLSSGMKTAVLISPLEAEYSQVMLIFYDSLTGVRHILYGNVDPEAIASGRVKTLNLRLMSHIIGSAENMQYKPGKEPPWQVKIK